MIATLGPSLREARGLRFIAMLITGWTLVRVMANWSPAYPVFDPAPEQAKAQAFSRDGTQSVRRAPHPVPVELARVTLTRETRAVLPVRVLTPPLRSAIGGRRDRPSPYVADPVQTDVPVSVKAVQGKRGRPDASLATGTGRSFPASRDLSGWSLSSWVYLRQGRGAPKRLPLSPQLGASQMGMRLSYGLGASGRWRVYGRGTVATSEWAQSEVAFGVTFAPVRDVPLDLALERRVAIGRQGRNALTAMISGGVSEAALPCGFQLDAYGEAGIVGVHSRDGFADGGVSVTHDLVRMAGSRLAAGGFAAGAVQSGAKRIDVGPRLLVHLPRLGGGSRIALDWRYRIAGNAVPDSGVAMTLATDF